MARKNPRFKQQFSSLLALLGLLVALLISEQNRVMGLSIMGTLEIVFAVIMEIHSKEIWEYSRKTYKPKHKGSLADKLFRPTKSAYTFNVYALLPLLFISGSYLLYVAYYS